MTHSLLSKIQTLTRHPARALRIAYSKLRLAPKSSVSVENDKLFLEYSRLARAQGFDRLYLLLSFDCDTPEDIPAADYMNDWLSERGVKTTYAVPGTQLQQGARVYRRLADSGAEFINHGASSHTEWRDGRYWSTTFYHQMTPAQIDADIRAGHKIFCDVLGRDPVGFRAPHFGNFQTEEQRAIVYETLRDLQYRFSSSTVPEFALRHGPLCDMGGLYEIPLSGTYSAPFTVFDSWSFIESPYNPVVNTAYADAMIETVQRLLTLDVVGVLSYYVDPAHVYNNDVFYDALKFVLDQKIPTLHLTQLLEITYPWMKY
jgi:hypothetical protein